MKFDRLGCLIREKYQPEWHPGNIGDSCYYTGHYLILSGDTSVSLSQFLAEPKGYYRHPELPKNPELDWGGPDRFSGDQFVPLVLATLLKGYNLRCIGITGTEWRIPGTKILLTPASWALIRGHYRLLNLFNMIQGLVLLIPWRWSDSKKTLERTSGSSVDYLSMIVIWHFLKTQGHWSWLAASKETCCDKVLTYYQTGADPEPNSDWFVELYLRLLRL